MHLKVMAVHYNIKIHTGHQVLFHQVGTIAIQVCSNNLNINLHGNQYSVIIDQYYNVSSPT